MKKLITLLLSIVLSYSVSAQINANAKQTADGNYVSVDNSISSAQSTGKTFTDKSGIKYEVFRSSKGKLFYIKISKKSGKEYKCYLKTE